MNTKLYTGNAGTQAVTGVGFQPDMCWFKARNNTDTHAIFDSVRGATKRIIPNNSTAERTQSNGLTSFDSDGFTVGDAGITNQNYNYASWNWKAGTAFTNDASSTGIGTIDSTGSFNNDNGFSIVSYTGTGSNGTIKHGLNSAPKMILIKQRSGTRTWLFGHNSLGWDKYLLLTSTDAQGTSSNYFQSTAPTTSVFSVGTGNETNESGGTYIAYCFAEKTGYSKFGSYQGVSSTDGAFINLGFKPTFFMVKASSRSESWYIFDNKREGYNPDNNSLYPDNTGTEGSTDWLDLVSNGVKFRYNSVGLNGTGETYIYMAIGQSLVGSNNVPCTAR